jgi:hypothetical protein
MTGILKTFSGLILDLKDPQPESICLLDIVMGLSREGRWANQRKRQITVAEHTVVGFTICSWQTNKPEVLKGWLLHDATEAYMRDIPKPLKDLIPEYTVIEDRLLKVIGDKYSCNPFHPLVKERDQYMTWKEEECFEQDDVSTFKYLKEKDARKTLIDLYHSEGIYL